MQQVYRAKDLGRNQTGDIKENTETNLKGTERINNRHLTTATNDKMVPIFTQEREKLSRNMQYRKKTRKKVVYKEYLCCHYRYKIIKCYLSQKL